MERSQVTAVVDPITTTQGSNAVVKATLYDENGDQLERSTKVAIKINGKTVTHVNTTNEELNVEIPTNELSSGNYKINIVFGELSILRAKTRYHYDNSLKKNNTKINYKEIGLGD